MSGTVNKTILVGNVGNDPESRTMQNGDTVVNVSIATSETWKDKSTGERKERTEWHRVVSFNQGINKIFNDYVRKGDKVYIEGQLETRSWEKDGQKIYTTEVVLRPFRGELTLLTAKGGEKAQDHQAPVEDRYSGNASRTTKSPSSRPAQGGGAYQDRRARSPEFA